MNSALAGWASRMSASPSASKLPVRPRIVLGLLSWLYLEAQFTLYAVEIDVVRHRQLWPRSLFAPPLTEADQRAYESYADVEERRVPQRVEMEVNEPVRDVRES